MANPRCYAIENNLAIANATTTNIVLSSTTAIRPEIYDLVMGFGSTPADNAIVVKVQRFTAAGSSAAYTPPPLDPGDPASTTVGGVTCTVEPTYTANKVVWHAALNQRATHRWVADPKGPLKMPATASNGLGLYGVNASATPGFDATVFFNE